MIFYDFYKLKALFFDRSLVGCFFCVVTCHPSKDTHQIVIKNDKGLNGKVEGGITVYSN